MANELTSNPLKFETAAAKTGQLQILEILWIDDAGDLVDTNTLQIVVNGVTINVHAQKTTDVGWQNPVAFRMGPFTVPLHTDEDGIDVTVIDNGALLVTLK